MAGPGFDPSLTEGQLILPAGVQCKTPWGQVRTGEISSLTGVTGDREIAYTSLFARLVLKGYVQVSPADVKAAERAIVAYRFGGSGAAYRGRLRAQARRRPIARGVIADELRQARIARHFRVAPPSGAEIAQYQSTYSERPARLVSATPAPSWLNHRGRGVAIDGMAPAPSSGSQEAARSRCRRAKASSGPGSGRRRLSERSRSRSARRDPRGSRSGSPRIRPSTTGSCTGSRARSRGRPAAGTGCRRSARSS